MSYSYYLIHGLALQGVFLALSFVWRPAGDAPYLYWGLILPAFAATLCVSAVLFLLVERPLSLAQASPRGQRQGHRLA